MPTIAVDPNRLAKIRRLEALAVRSWPADEFFYDRVWHVAYYTKFPLFLTESINIITPLDSLDRANIKQRIAMIKANLAGKFYVKLTPLAALDIILQLGLKPSNYTLENKVFIAEVNELATTSTVDIIPIRLEEYGAALIQYNLLQPKALGYILDKLASVKGESFYFSACDGKHIARYVLDKGFAYIDCWPQTLSASSDFLASVAYRAVQDGAVYIWYKRIGDASLSLPGFSALYSEFYYEI